MICKSDIIACLGLEFLASLAYFSPYGYDASYEEGLEEIGYNSCLSLPHMTHYRLPTFPHALVVPSCKPASPVHLLFFLFAVNIYVNFLVVETQVTSDGSALGCRVLVPPDEIVIFLSVDNDIIILPMLIFIEVRPRSSLTIGYPFIRA